MNTHWCRFFGNWWGKHLEIIMATPGDSTFASHGQESGRGVVAWNCGGWMGGGGTRPEREHLNLS